MSKRILIIVLAGVNLLLLWILIQATHSSPSAIAQMVAEERGREGYLVVAAKADLNNEAIFVFDTAHDLLHVFRTPSPYVAGTPLNVVLMDSRDLTADFQDLRELFLDHPRFRRFRQQTPQRQQEPQP
jgi:hypothetical protein